jgi:poly-beta-1,6-N-acetyl-D-glucosamine biosynthesis protein PgaD
MHRRHTHEPVQASDLAKLYRLPRGDVERWQSSRILMMQHDTNGILTAVKSKGRNFEIPEAA